MDMSTIWPILKPILAGQIRTWLAGFGAILVHSGAIEQSDEASFVKIGTGLVIWILVAGWSWWQKTGQSKFIAVIAKMKPVAAPAATVGEAVKAATAAAKVAAVLLLALMLSGLIAPSAHAQAKLTGNIIKDIQSAAVSKPAAGLDSIATVLAKPFQDIANFIGADADGAVVLSTAIPNIQDGHGQQCWMAMQSFGTIIKAHPIPITFHVINDYESLRLLGIATNNLCSNVHCTQVFADFTAMAQAASPMPLAIPSLHDLCTKVPQIAVVAPISAPAAAAVVPAETPEVK